MAISAGRSACRASGRLAALALTTSLLLDLLRPTLTPTFTIPSKSAQAAPVLRRQHVSLAGETWVALPSEAQARRGTSVALEAWRPLQWLRGRFAQKPEDATPASSVQSSTYDSIILNPMLARILASRATATYDANVLRPMLARIAASRQEAQRRAEEQERERQQQLKKVAEAEAAEAIAAAAAEALEKQPKEFNVFDPSTW